MSGGQIKTHCKRGHLLEGSNVRIAIKDRRCRQCEKDRYRENRKAVDPDYQPRALTRGPTRWTDEYLTERWADRKVRRQTERHP